MIALKVWALGAIVVTELIVIAYRAGLGPRATPYPPNMAVVMAVMVILTWPFLLMVVVRGMFSGDDS